MDKKAYQSEQSSIFAAKRNKSKNQISKQDFERATQRKYYEAARFYQKRGKHDKAQQFYSVADAKSLKILGLRILNALGLSI